MLGLSFLPFFLEMLLAVLQCLLPVPKSTMFVRHWPPPVF